MLRRANGSMYSSIFAIQCLRCLSLMQKWQISLSLLQPSSRHINRIGWLLCSSAWQVLPWLDFINFITGFQHGALKPTIFFIQILRTAPSLPAKSTAHFLSWEMAIIIDCTDEGNANLPYEWNSSIEFLFSSPSLIAVICANKVATASNSTKRANRLL